MTQIIKLKIPNAHFLGLARILFVVLSALTFFSTSGCKDDGQGIQASLLKSLQMPTNKKSAAGGDKNISPTSQDRLSQANSIPSCPDDSKLSGQAFPRGIKQGCTYKDKDGVFVKHGEERTWHKNGNLNRQSFYEDGELHGELIEWYPDKTAKSRTLYQHGKRHGQSSQWNNEGKKLIDSTYVNDELNGLYIEYFLNGKPKVKGSYLNDLKSGLWEEYNERGEVSKKAEYKANLKHGKSVDFYPSGSIKSKGSYNKDQPIGHWIYYDKNGIKQSEGNLFEGKRHDRWLEYDKQGQVRRTTYYDMGKKLDSIVHKTSSSINGSGDKSFGSKDILGAEPPIKSRSVRPKAPKKKERPQALKQEGWSPL